MRWHGPRTPSASAANTALIFCGSIWCRTSTRSWKTVLTSVATLRDCTTCPRASRLAVGWSGGIRSTYLAPSTVVALICAPIFAGMYWISSGSMSSCRLTLSPWRLIAATWPTCTPRIFTFAPGFITSPARSAANVMGTDPCSLPANRAMLKPISPTTTTTSSAVHHNGWTRASPDLRFIVLSGHVEVAAAAVDGQRHEQDHHGRHHQRCPHRAPDGVADTGGPAGGGVAVIGVHQHDHDCHRKRLEERPDQVGRDQEGVEGGGV